MYMYIHFLVRYVRTSVHIHMCEDITVVHGYVTLHGTGNY